MLPHLFCLVLLLTGVAVSGASADVAPARKRVLVFTKSSGFQHEAVKLKLNDGREGYAFPVLRALAQQNNIELVFSKDGSLFTPEYLAQFDAFFFYTTGDLTMRKSDPRGDDLPPMTPAGKAALLAAIAGGKGFLGVHSATDTFHSFGRNDHVPERFLDDGVAADDYVKMIGGEFIRHGKQQVTKLTVADAKFPGIAAVPKDFSLHEEWYSLKDFAPDLHVLLVQQTAGMEGAEYQRPAYPCTWVRMHGKGRVFYSSLGHREDVWTNPVYQSILAGALNWALGRVDADVTPNLTKVVPGANQLPIYAEPPPKAPEAAKKN
ncbi:MAG TPA: ThuA domain-containing protein [Lacunisphaera sp.]